VIRINLLPAELRRGNRVAARVIAVAFGAAVAVSASVGWLGIVYFGDLAAAENTLEEVVAKLTEKEKRVVYHDLLETNKKDYAARVQTIQDIGKSRRIWSRFLDEMLDVVNNNGDTERHLAWFSAMTVKSDTKGATVTMPTSIQDKEMDRVANFHEDIEAAPFAQDLAFKSEPMCRLEESKTHTPPLSLAFPLSMQFKPTIVVEPKSAAKPAAKPAEPAKK
jgi:hypothetical protein